MAVDASVWPGALSFSRILAPGAPGFTSDFAGSCSWRRARIGLIAKRLRLSLIHTGYESKIWEVVKGRFSPGGIMSGITVKLVRVV